MAVYQVEQYYIHMSIKGINSHKLKDYLSESGLDDYDIDGVDATITIDSIECANVAELFEEEINQLRVTS